MNRLFRNIRENDWLDALEESDDEEEFENIDLDKFVDMEKEYLIECQYFPAFKKWSPVIEKLPDIEDTFKNIPQNIERIVRKEKL